MLCAFNLYLYQKYEATMSTIIKCRLATTKHALYSIILPTIITKSSFQNKAK